MINFIVVDDNIEVLKIVERIIDKSMMKNTFSYKKHMFSRYDHNFDKIMRNPIPNKIYLLDIETKDISGIDVARKIRNRDINSVIIFITAHDELTGIASKEKLLFLTYICKFDDFEEQLKSAILKSLEVLEHKTIIRFNDKGTLYTIPIKEILYITRDSVERKCLIKTESIMYKVNKTLTELEKLTDNSLKKTHRACLVNMERVRIVDKKKNYIIFDNGEKINLISHSYKKELV